METNSDRLLFAQLRKNERNAYITLYDQYFNDLARYILNNNGSREDAEDNFQETLLVLVHKIQKPDFTLESSLKTYLFAINRNLWFKKLRSQHKTISQDEIDQVVYEEDFLYLQEKVAREENRLGFLKNLLENITGHCVILITRIFFKMEEPEEMIRELGYKNAHTFQNQKYKCISQLRKAGKNLHSHG
jgi:RNA polymerase sigma factor (sigma-70 family)